MGLKIAEFQRTNRFGATENVYLTWQKILDADIDDGGKIAFSAYENQAEATRKNRKELFVLEVDHNAILAMFAQTGVVALVISDLSWQLAQTTAFIPDFVLNQETNRYDEVKKSLTDLNATITDVGNPFA